MVVEHAIAPAQTLMEPITRDFFAYIYMYICVYI